MIMLEARGCSREHEQFKDVFGMTTKGAYFVFVRSTGLDCRMLMGSKLG